MITWLLITTTQIFVTFHYDILASEFVIEDWRLLITPFSYLLRPQMLDIGFSTYEVPTT